MKINRENIGWIFCSAILAALLILSIILGFSGWYFKTEQSSTNDMELGKTVQASIMKNQSSTIALNLSGSYLFDEKLPQVISIKNNEDEESLFVRAKAIITNGNNVQKQLNLIQTASWVYNENDGYYYLSNALVPQNKVALCSHIYLDDSMEIMSSKDYIVTFIFESLSSNQDIVEFWGVNRVQNV